MNTYDVYAWNIPGDRLVIHYQDYGREVATVRQRALHRANVWNEREKRHNMRVTAVEIEGETTAVPGGELPLFDLNGNVNILEDGA